MELVNLIGSLAPADGEHRTAIPSLSLFRYSSATEPECGVTKASLVMAVQGRKRVTLGTHAYEYGHTHYLITSVDLPLMAQVVSASPGEPYLCFVYELDLTHIANLMTDMGLTRPDGIPEGGALSICAFSAPLVETGLRLIRLLKTPGDIPILAPLIERELLYRLLLGEQGMRLRHLTFVDSQSHKISKAIEWLKHHYAEPLRIEFLAGHANMSVSSLHHHFKAITSMSPLQYQKQLRLHEARRLMLTQFYDVASAAHTVGYGSPSQFSREYSRLFGAAPVHDISRLRYGDRLGHQDQTEKDVLPIKRS